MNNISLYLATVLIWGSTWLAIKFQLGVVDPALSVAYRFGLAALILFVVCWATGRRLRFARRDHLFMLAQGGLLFALNYLLFYIATEHITSGLVAVTFCTVIVMNIANGALFLGTPVRREVVMGAGLGLIGIGLVFWPELAGFDLSDAGFFGLLLCLAATYSASLGNIVSARNQKRALPVLQTNAYGMAYGAVLMVGYVLASGTPLNFDWSVPYTLSLLYLAVFGSVIAFGCYLTLIGRIGADKASYASLLFPLVALGLSTAFEGYQWTGYALAGMCLILVGNVLALGLWRGVARVVGWKAA